MLVLKEGEEVREEAEEAAPRGLVGASQGLESHGPSSPHVWVTKKASEDFPGGSVARFRAPNAEGPGSIPGQGTRSRMIQLRVLMPQQ